MSNEWVEEIINRKASKIASEKSKGDKSKYAEIMEKETKRIKKEELNNIQGEVSTDILHMLKHEHSQVKNRYMMRRGPLLPEYLTVEGRGGRAKEIRTYETSLERTFDPYVHAMSKHLAIIRVFPEFSPYSSK